jgi:hypothetical protein
LKSDQLRVTILIGAITSSLLLVVFVTRFFYDEFQAAFHGRFERFLVAVSIIFGANVIYLLGERFVLGRLIKKQQKPSAMLKYLSAFVETSIPTAGMMVGSTFLGPVYTLFTPAPFIYPLFSWSRGRSENEYSTRFRQSPSATVSRGRSANTSHPK